ncbi:LacI family DNA-binding transcriptional regulator [Actinocrispum sp. NPDC049592]|uniref:LacI family DNA-binding transcriptional regulator n=1 Tax=Actinocrispum sp. NPDC049592 TaxID=3154835 RepID=UPI00342DE927
MTIREIAQRAGVSESAVSFALNNRPGVSEYTRRLILQVAEEMKWRPNSAAKALGGAKAGAIGLVFARPAETLGVEPFFLRLVSGIQSALSASSTALMFQVVENVEAETEIYRRWWSERRVDGVLVVDPRTDDPRPGLLAELGLPALLIGGPDPTGTLPSIWADDARAMTSIVEHLTSLGHNRIAHVAGLPELVHTQHRIEAFHRATGAQSVTTDYSDEAGRRVTRELLTAAEPPTAIVYDNDIMAVAGIGAAAALGRAVPADVSLVAWDDSPLCRLTHPMLTALVRDTYAFGRRAAQRLVEVMDGTATGDLEDELPRLTPRGSTQE